MNIFSQQFHHFINKKSMLNDFRMFTSLYIFKSQCYNTWELKLNVTKNYPKTITKQNKYKKITRIQITFTDNDNYKIRMEIISQPSTSPSLIKNIEF